MPTVQDCITALQTTYATVTSAQALGYFNHVHREIVALARIQSGSEDVPMVAGQGEYALDTTDQVLSIAACHYHDSPTSSLPLHLTTPEQLDAEAPHWRTQPGTEAPTRYYVTSASTGGGVKLGLYPVPAQSAVGGYPKATVFGPKFKALIATDSLPAVIGSIRVYVEGMKRLAASDIDVLRFDECDLAYSQELHRTLAAINALTEGPDGPQIVPVWMKSRPVI